MNEDTQTPVTPADDNAADATVGGMPTPAPAADDATDASDATAAPADDDAEKPADEAAAA